MGPTLMLAKCIDEKKSIKQGYNTHSNYDVLFFIYWLCDFHTSTQITPAPFAFSTQNQLLRGNGKIIEGAFRP